MKAIRRSDVFDKWLIKLRDPQARTRILARIKRLTEGNPGDVKPAGEGLSEMRIDYGPGYRVYITKTPAGRLFFCYVVAIKLPSKGT
jgi:putative addiction module killer protein